MWRRAVTGVRRVGSRGQHDLISRYCLSEEQQALKASVAEWAQAELAPMAAKVDRDNLFPEEVSKEREGKIRGLLTSLFR